MTQHILNIRNESIGPSVQELHRLVVASNFGHPAGVRSPPGWGTEGDNQTHFYGCAQGAEIAIFYRDFAESCAPTWSPIRSLAGTDFSERIQKVLGGH